MCLFLKRRSIHTWVLHRKFFKIFIVTMPIKILFHDPQISPLNEQNLTLYLIEFTGMKIRKGKNKWMRWIKRMAKSFPVCSTGYYKVHKHLTNKYVIFTYSKTRLWRTHGTYSNSDPHGLVAVENDFSLIWICFKLFIST